jgi:uncharacterized membrane protein
MPVAARGSTPGPPTARVVLLAAAAVGFLAAALATSWTGGRVAPLIGWDTAALTFCAWVWINVWPMDSHATRSHAVRDDPGQGWTDLIVLGAATASLIAVGAVLFGAGHARGNLKYVEAAFALGSVFISWTLVHTVFTLRYARLYFNGTPGGIDFNQDEPPQYSDFAYVAFTIGMTFQVSDTDICDRTIRRMALRHAWLSFPLGAVIIAASINLVAGLSK